MTLVMDVGGTEHRVRVSREEHDYIVWIDDREYVVDVTDPANGAGALSMLITSHRNLSVEAWPARTPAGYQVSILGETFDIEVEDALRAGLKRLHGGGAAATEETIKVPMPGVVVDIKAKEGDEVAAGEAIVIVEAMKMRNEFAPKAAGRVARILVETGQSVERNQALVVISREPEATS